MSIGEYDETGRLVLEAVFNDCDDLLERTDHFIYDLSGNRLQQTRDWTSTTKSD